MMQVILGDCKFSATKLKISNLQNRSKEVWSYKLSPKELKGVKSYILRENARAKSTLQKAINKVKS
jgi:hypothetical protein